MNLVCALITLLKAFIKRVFVLVQRRYGGVYMKVRGRLNRKYREDLKEDFDFVSEKFFILDLFDEKSGKFVLLGLVDCKSRFDELKIKVIYIK